MSVVGVLDRLGVARQQLRVTQQPLELGGEREGVARLEERTQLALAQQLLVLREPRDHRHRAPGHRAQHELRGGRGSGGGRHGDRRTREVLRLGAVARAGQGHALAHAARQRRRRRGGRLAQPDRGAPVEVGREAAERAQEQPQRAALLLVREHDLGRTVGLRRPARGDPRPGGSRCSRRGSSARSGRAWPRSSPCGRRGGRRGAPPPCAPPASRRSARWSSGRCRRSARASAAARPTRRSAQTARARAGSRARRGRADPPACATRPAASTPSRRAGTEATGPTATMDAQPSSAQSASGSERSALTFARPSRTSSRESDGAITTTRWPREHSSSERRSTKRLTSWCCSQGQGVTWAIAKGTLGGYAGASPRGRRAPGPLPCRRTRRCTRSSRHGGRARARAPSRSGLRYPLRGRSGAPRP